MGTEAERCRDCDRLIAGDSDWAAHDAEEPTRPDLCWGACTPIDWRARALAAEGQLQHTLEVLRDEQKRYLALSKRMDDRGFGLRDAIRSRNVARRELTVLAAQVQKERDLRGEWLASLPDGSCTNPPPDALTEAEEAIAKILRSLTEVPKDDDIPF